MNWRRTQIKFVSTFCCVEFLGTFITLKYVSYKLFAILLFWFKKCIFRRILQHFLGFLPPPVAGWILICCSRLIWASSPVVVVTRLLIFIPINSRNSAPDLTLPLYLFASKKNMIHNTKLTFLVHDTNKMYSSRYIFWGWSYQGNGISNFMGLNKHLLL